MRTMKNLALAAFTAAALALAGCGGGGGGTSSMDPPPVVPTPYETAVAAIAAATTPEAAQAAYDAVKDDVTAAQGDMLQAAVDARQAALATMARADAQRMALMDAAGMIDTTDLSTQDLVDAARTAIAGLRQAIAEAVDVDDTSMYQTMLDDAVGAVDMAQGGIDTATRRMNQMTALESASETLQGALAALAGDTPTQAQINAASNALAALNTAIADGADLTDTEKAPYQREADNAAAPITTAQNARDGADDEAEKTAAAAMAVTAKRLYDGLEHGLGDATNVRTGASDAAGVVSVTIGSDAAVPLSEDKKTTVAALHDWEGKRHTAEPTGDVGTYEAVVYSNVGEPTQGQKFNAQYTDLDATSGERTIDTSTEAVQALVDSASFDQSAGIKEFELGTNLQRVVIAGSFHGVSGTYYCTPAASSTCAAQVAADGFTLGGTADADNAFSAGGGAWTFKPGNPEARVTSMPDNIYASYGWWLHKSEDGETFTASAFATSRGTVTAAAGIDTLQGTATYMGGAAGKYSLRGSTGGTNDAGHFTARAMLEADFGDDMITGTIDMFVGADGESRDWSVELMEQGVNATGTILGDDGTGTPGTDEKMTKWTIGGTAGDAGGQWSGTLYDNGDDGVPKVGTGTFHSTYGQGGNDGRMVGAFGVNVQ